LKDYVVEFMNDLGFIVTEHIGNINHPLTYQLIQEDLFFLNKKLITQK
jgi:hypothetical protein